MIAKANAIAVRTLFVYRSTIMASLPIRQPTRQPGTIAVPVLVVSNQDDTCAVSPPSDTPNILASLTRSPREKLAMVTSGQIARRSDPCEEMSPHGYFGIESAVVQRISDWIRAAGGH